MRRDARGRARGRGDTPRRFVRRGCARAPVPARTRSHPSGTVTALRPGRKKRVAHRAMRPGTASHIGRRRDATASGPSLTTTASPTASMRSPASGPAPATAHVSRRSERRMRVDGILASVRPWAARSMTRSRKVKRYSCRRPRVGETKPASIKPTDDGPRKSEQLADFAERIAFGHDGTGQMVA